MNTRTFPAVDFATTDELAPGDWAFVKGHPVTSSYSLIMMTDKPCEAEGASTKWVLAIEGGSAGFYCSKHFGHRAIRLDGDVRFSLPIHQQKAVTGYEYQPGLLYSAITDEGIYLVAQVSRVYGAASVLLDGTGMVDEIPDHADLLGAGCIEYRAPGDAEWSELVRIDTPIE